MWANEDQTEIWPWRLVAVWLSRQVKASDDPTPSHDSVRVSVSCVRLCWGTCVCICCSELVSASVACVCVCVPCDVAELHSDPLRHIPLLWEHASVLLLVVHQLTLDPGVAPVNLIQPCHLTKRQGERRGGEGKGHIETHY